METIILLIGLGSIFATGFIFGCVFYVNCWGWLEDKMGCNGPEAKWKAMFRK